MKKEIVIKIRIDSEKDEFGNLIELKGFDNGKPILNKSEIVGWLEIVKLQESMGVLQSEARKK